MVLMAWKYTVCQSDGLWGGVVELHWLCDGDDVLVSALYCRQIPEDLSKAWSFSDDDSTFSEKNVTGGRLLTCVAMG
eukprot:CAMPEP_0194060904 /NCGR_PEP_ID=MMETSP0009_2-20130614/73070_1 /TAXON_ID=210454 /ORGANISM="Grammatophora oceanica, Strain CCMP 410" /LENGTH=76 /DNA_ID=CAMNT_0038711979 /DNA_START=181 /DNA_END=411 /DNA_ORIENTATION=-